MAVKLDLRTAITFTFPDAAVTYAGGGANVDLSSASVGGGLLAAKNLSDLASAADARMNLGATTLGEGLFTAADAPAARDALGVNVIPLMAQCNVAATTAGVTYVFVPSGYDGDVVSVVAMNSADPGGDLAITTAIGPSGGPFVPITGGNLVVANAAPAGSITTATPSAANDVRGDRAIEVAWDNGAVNAINVTVTILLSRT